jgi:hypothetical protein
MAAYRRFSTHRPRQAGALRARAAFAALAAILLPPAWAAAQTSPAPEQTGQALAQTLANPLAAQDSILFESDYDWGLGPAKHGSQYVLTVEPQIPVRLNSGWYMISRTDLTFISQADTFLGQGRQNGFGDLEQSLFLSPSALTKWGWVWGVGPIFLLPTATNDLGQKKWGAGPTAGAIKQQGPWTVGILVDHIWSFAGDPRVDAVSATYFQPLVAYTASTATTLTVTAENTYDWTHHALTVPINVSLAQLFDAKPHGLPAPIQIEAGYRFYPEAPGVHPDGGLRLSLSVLIPR